MRADVPRGVAGDDGDKPVAMRDRGRALRLRERNDAPFAAVAELEPELAAGALAVLRAPEDAAVRLRGGERGRLGVACDRERRQRGGARMAVDALRPRAGRGTCRARGSAGSRRNVCQPLWPVKPSSAFPSTTTATCAGFESQKRTTSSSRDAVLGTRVDDRRHARARQLGRLRLVELEPLDRVAPRLVAGALRERLEQVDHVVLVAERRLRRRASSATSGRCRSAAASSSPPRAAARSTRPRRRRPRARRSRRSRSRSGAGR